MSLRYCTWCNVMCRDDDCRNPLCAVNDTIDERAKRVERDKFALGYDRGYPPVRSTMGRCYGCYQDGWSDEHNKDREIFWRDGTAYCAPCWAQKDAAKARERERQEAVPREPYVPYDHARGRETIRRFHESIGQHGRYNHHGHWEDD